MTSDQQIKEDASPVQQLRRSIAHAVHVMPVGEQRRLLAHIEQMQAALDAAHDLIEATGCSPDNGHLYWGLRETANG